VRRVTLDSNIYVSALEFGGTPKVLLDAGRDGQVHISISQQIIDETIRILRDRFHWSDDELADAQVVLNASTHRVKPTVILEVVKDDPTMTELWNAPSSRSGSIITNDKDLGMGVYDGIRMIRVGSSCGGTGLSRAGPAYV
jgi:putative PIN family toxin of toxin-antitoxin system